MKQELETAVAAAVKELFATDVAVELTRPDVQFGDYATNVALQLAKSVGKNPREIAEVLAEKLSGSASIATASVAGPGFVNLMLNNETLVKLAESKPAQTLAGKTVVAEYSDPNPFKVLHAGHLYTSIVGDAIANLLEATGAKVHRVNFGGDVGLHVGKTMWAILQDLGGESPAGLEKYHSLEERVTWLSQCYITGNNAYDDDPEAKAAIVTLNKRVYQLHTDNDHDSPFAQIYWQTRQWSYDYFDSFYARIGSHFEKYYPESAVAELGLQTVREQLNKGVFETSDGAVVFKGEPYGLHTRVFINSEGIPTYEAKDTGLIMQKWEDYHFDKSVVITANEQEQYMAVVLKAIEQFKPELAKASVHLTHGMVKLTGGEKMSSRKGNILRATDVLDAAAMANKEATKQENDQAVLGAVKYAFLKQRTGGDIIYDPAESVSILGNSGPYLQYAHARARSILAKSGEVAQAIEVAEFEADERGLLRKIGEYAEAIDKAAQELMPHHICTYLYELAQEFNRFYEHNRVVGDDRQKLRLSLVAAYANVLQAGLKLLGIPAPDKM